MLTEMDFMLTDFRENDLSGAHWPAHLCDVEKVAQRTEDLPLRIVGFKDKMFILLKTKRKEKETVDVNVRHTCFLKGNLCH